MGIGGGKGGGGGCFIAGTQILVPNPEASTDDLYLQRNIEEIKIGDKVMSFNEDLKLEEATVTAVFVHEPKQVCTVKFWGGNYELTGTPEHLVYSVNLGAFEALKDVNLVRTRYGGALHVVERTLHEEPQVVYNLTVEPNHTYVANQILVHNMGGGKGGGDEKSVESTYNPMQMALLPFVQSAVSKYQDLYGNYYWPAEEKNAQNYLRWVNAAMGTDQNVQDYLIKRQDQLVGMADDTNPLLDDSRKDLIRRLTEGEDVLADRYRGMAAADTASSFGTQRTNLENKMNSLGINPSSGAWVSAMGNLANQEALAKSSAMTKAGWDAEKESLTRQQGAQALYTNPSRLLGDATAGAKVTDFLNAGVATSQPESQTVSGGSSGGGASGLIGGLFGSFMGK